MGVNTNMGYLGGMYKLWVVDYH